MVRSDRLLEPEIVRTSRYGRKFGSIDLLSYSPESISDVDSTVRDKNKLSWMSSDCFVP